MRALVYIKYYVFFLFTFSFYFLPASGQAVVTVPTGVVPSHPRFLASIFIAQRVQQSHCSSIFYRVLFTLSRSCAFCKSICAQEKRPYEFICDIRVCTRGGTPTHETDLPPSPPTPGPFRSKPGPHVLKNSALPSPVCST